MDVQAPQPLSSRLTLYQYNPLQSPRAVRLITLKPGSKSAPIDFSLTEACIDDELCYKAISYTWATEDGDDKRSRLVFCDGGYIRVTVNCEAVLRRFRDPTVENVLWIDAICINQEDISERGKQVQLMGKVYSKASQVLIWLGEAPEGATSPELTLKHFFIGLHNIAVEISNRRHNGEIPYEGPRYRSFVNWRNQRTKSIKVAQMQTSQFDAVFDRRWWTRVWVIQEMALANSALLFCGDAILDLLDLHVINICVCEEGSQASIKAFSFLGLAAGNLSLRMDIRNRVITSDAELASWAIFVLSSLRQCEASDPRDKVYGIIGLLNHFGQIFPAPDYNRGVGTVFTDAAKALITHSNSLDILCYSSWPSNWSDLPSWVPDWSLESNADSGPDSFKAAKGSRAICFLPHNKGELCIKGTFISTASQVGKEDPSPLGASPLKGYDHECIRIWQQWCQMASSMAPNFSSERLEETLHRTLCWDRTQMGEPLSREYKSRFDAWFKIITYKYSPIPEVEIFLTWNNDAMLYADQLLVLGRRRAFCITADGHMAMVPGKTQPGDRIALFAGGPTPFVVRQTGDHYILIGSCYVHGIMDGEAWPADESELEWITLQ